MSKHWNDPEHPIYLVSNPAKNKIYLVEYEQHRINFAFAAITYEESDGQGRVFTKLSFHSSFHQLPPENITEIHTSHSHPEEFDLLAELLADRVTKRECDLATNATQEKICSIFTGEVCEAMLTALRERSDLDRERRAVEFLATRGH